MDNLLKRIIILIWAIWSFFVTLSNICDGLKNLGILPNWFKFISGNFGYIQTATQIYSFPVWLNAILFILVIVWEAAMCILFFRAYFKCSKEDTAIVILPFLSGIALFGGFLIMDEFLIAYDRLGTIEQSHLGFFTGMLASLLTIRLFSIKK
ncbi:MAG: hypothetical protein P4L45_00150 [Ignavibacteriaceae bacterium]|nr:hypothetical protein [Ignavibacteriaceae bacterium]